VPHTALTNITATSATYTAPANVPFLSSRPLTSTSVADHEERPGYNYHHPPSAGGDSRPWPATLAARARKGMALAVTISVCPNGAERQCIVVGFQYSAGGAA
jgi:hypothetical protein